MKLLKLNDVTYLLSEPNTLIRKGSLFIDESFHVLHLQCAKKDTQGITKCKVVACTIQLDECFLLKEEQVNLQFEKNSISCECNIETITIHADRAPDGFETLPYRDDQGYVNIL